MNTFRNITLIVIITASFLLTAGCTTTAVPPDEVVEVPPTNTPEPMDTATAVPSPTATTLPASSPTGLPAAPTAVLAEAAVSAEALLQASLEKLAQTNYHYDIQLDMEFPGSDEMVTVATIGDFATPESWQGVSQFYEGGEPLGGYDYNYAGSTGYYRTSDTESWQYDDTAAWHPENFLRIPGEYLHNIELTGSETWEGIPVYRVTATMSRPLFLVDFFMMNHMAVSGELAASFLIGQETGDLYQITTSGPAVIDGDEFQTETTTTLSEYGKEITISLPAPELTGHTIGEDAISCFSVYSAAFAQGDQQLVAVGEHWLKLWDIADLSQPQQIWNVPDLDEYDALRTVIVHPDGHTAAVVTQDGHLYLVDLVNPETAVSQLPGQLPTFASHWPPFHGSAILFSADGTQLIGLDADGYVNVWSMADGRHDVTNIRSEEALAYNGRSIATSIGDTIYLWDWPISGTEPKATVTLTDYGGRAHDWEAFSIRHLALSADGKWLAAHANDNVLRIWSMDQLDASPTLIEITIASMSFSPDSRFLASIVSGNGPDEIQVWPVGNWDASVRLASHEREGAIWSLAFSPDGQMMVTTGVDDTVRLWSMDDLEFESSD